MLIRKTFGMSDGLHEGSHGNEVVPAQAGVVACLAVSCKATIAVSVHSLAVR